MAAVHTLRRQQLIALDIETTFAFFADAANLERLTPPWLHFEILSQLPIKMAEGRLIDYKLKLRGIPIRWQSGITDWQPPYRFVDEQRHGPYQLWQHTHTFQAAGMSTSVTDEVRYSVPGGGLADKFLVRPDLDRIFDYRQRQMELWVEEMRGG